MHETKHQHSDIAKHGDAAPVSFDRRSNALTCWLYGELTPTLAGQFVLAMEQHTEAAAVVFRISSRGGNVGALGYLKHAIKSFPGRSIAIVDLDASSSAAIVALSCDRMLMRTDSRILLHRCQTTVQGNSDTLAQMLRTLRAHDFATFKTILAKAAPRYRNSLREAIEEGRFLDAATVHAWGLCSSIIHPLLAYRERAISGAS